MSITRNIKMVLKSNSVIEGAGVHLKRAFGSSDAPLFDPFLMLDDFRSNNPQHYTKGFPWHPHRGIETISYVLRGKVEHGDSMGNRGVIAAGDVQWMTAGSGIIHQEMPEGDSENFMCGFQLWANLPAAKKMMDPRYREVKSNEIPEVELENGVKAKIIAGSLAGQKGPVKDVVIEPEFMDIFIPANTEYIHKTTAGHTAIIYVIEGAANFGKPSEGMTDFAKSATLQIENEHVILFDDGDQISVKSKDAGVRFLIFSGKPLNEPVAWQGPIVMNTQEELRTAFAEYQNNTFIKHK